MFGCSGRTAMVAPTLHACGCLGPPRIRRQVLWRRHPLGRGRWSGATSCPRSLAPQTDGSSDSTDCPGPLCTLLPSWRNALSLGGLYFTLQSFTTGTPTHPARQVFYGNAEAKYEVCADGAGSMVWHRSAKFRLRLQTPRFTQALYSTVLCNLFVPYQCPWVAGWSTVCSS